MAIDPRLEPLFEAATGLFVGAGRYARFFSRGKLRHDPVFFALLERGLLPGSGTLLDVGCGQGILLALLSTAKEQFESGHWPRGWPAPPANLVLRGMEMRKGRARAARTALGSRAVVDHCDAKNAEFQRCSAIVMLDVLFYLEAPEQDRLLQKAARALDSQGVLLIREPDTSAGTAFMLTQCAERFAGVLRGQFRQRLNYRSAGDWLDSLERLGFCARAEPMSGGTPFANVLFVATRRAA